MVLNFKQNLMLIEVIEMVLILYRRRLDGKVQTIIYLLKTCDSAQVKPMPFFGKYDVLVSVLRQNSI